MISATGKPGEPIVTRRVSDVRRVGFTLIEILIVISILVVLGSIVFVAQRAALGTAKVKGTKAKIASLRLKIEEYHRITGHYPPDGIDSEVKNAKGTALRGSAALYYALSTPFKYREISAGIAAVKKSVALMEFSESDLSDPLDEFPGAREILDAFNTPFHYDNTENGRFRPQGGEVHYPPIEENDHPVDPRTLDESRGGVPNPGRPQSLGYDLWSHGVREHSTSEEDGKNRPAIATWNLGKK